MYILSVSLIVAVMLSVIWWLTRPSEEDRFIQTAQTEQLMRYLRQRGHPTAR